MFSQDKRSSLDKFKRRMIRTVARLYREGKAEDEVWEVLEKEIGENSKSLSVLWERMRVLTLKKLRRLTQAGDRAEDVPAIARMTLTDWLLVDLIIVHEKIDLIDRQNINSDNMTTLLINLLNLVQAYNIENCSVAKLPDAWMKATLLYNSKGHQVSPMLLQRRWYQVKELSRTNFYKFWFKYRGNLRMLDNAKQYAPSPVEISIAIAFPQLITTPFIEWNDCVEQGIVIMPEEFEKLRAQSVMETEANEAVEKPDIEIIEQNIETIDLDQDSDETGNKSDENNMKNETAVQIKKEASDNEVDIHDDNSRDSGNSLDDRECNIESYDNNADMVMPVIAAVTGGAIDLNAVESTTQRNEVSPDECAEETNYISNKVDHPILGGTLSQLKDKLIKDIIKKEPNLEINSDDNDIPQDTGISDNTQIKIESNVRGDNDFNGTQLQFDGGIEFVDDGIDYVEEDNYFDNSKDNDISSTNQNEEDAPKIDMKLLLCPVVYTTKLDNMSVYKDKNIRSVIKGESILKIIRESKPINKQLDYRNELPSEKVTARVDVASEQVLNINIKKEIQDTQPVDTAGDSEDSESDIIEASRIKITSHLLRKPRTRTYNPIQLCKNPDFNTRLKRLSVGFFSYFNNRILLKDCKPMTIDLSKAFESKLVNGTLYLKPNEASNVQDVETPMDNNVAATTVIPSPAPVQSLMDVDKILEEELKKRIMERNKVITLPDISEVRRINQHLLTAQVPPMRVEVPEAMKQPKIELSDKSERDDQFDVIARKALTDNPVIVNSAIENNIDTISSGQARTVLQTSNVKPINVNTATTSNRQTSQNEQTDSSGTDKKLPPSKQKKKCIKKKYPVGWFSKSTVQPQVRDDAFLTLDTMYKIISVLKKELGVVLPDYKNLKYSTFLACCEEFANTNNNTKQPKQSIATNVQNKKPKPATIRRRLKKAIEPCCWAKAKLEMLIGIKRRAVKEHECPKICECCCRSELVQYHTLKAASNLDSTEKKDDNTVTTSGDVQVIQETEQTDHTVEQENTILDITCNEVLDIDEPVQAVEDETITNTMVTMPSLCTKPTQVYTNLSHKNKTKENTTEDNTIEENIIEENTTEKNTIEENAIEENTIEENTIEENAIEENAIEENAIEEKAIEENAIEENAIEEKAIEENVIEENVIEENVIEENVIEENAIEENTIEENTTQKTTTQKNTTQKCLPRIKAGKRKLYQGQKLVAPVTSPSIKTVPPSASVNYPSIVIDSSGIQTNLSTTLPSLTRRPAPCPSKPEKIVQKKQNQKKLLYIEQERKNNNCPIYIGKDKLLLTNVPIPLVLSESKPIPEKPPVNTQNALQLPAGVQIILLPDGTLTYSVEPEFNDPSALSVMPVILASLQQQLNTGGIRAPQGQTNAGTSLDADAQNIPPNTAENIELLNPAQNIDVSSQSMVDNNKQIENNETESASTDKNVTEHLNTTNEDNVTESVNTPNEHETIVNRKSLLSDLMQMSGISEEDIAVPEPVPIVTPVQTIPQIAIETPSLNKQPIIKENYPKLYTINSYVELKYAYNKAGTFYKMDVLTGAIAVIQVCIKRSVQQVSKKPPKPDVIDLTGETEASLSVKPSTATPLPPTDPSKLPPVVYRRRKLEVHNNLLEVHNNLKRFVPKPTSNRTVNILNAMKSLLKDTPTVCVESDSDSSDNEPLMKKVRRKYDAANVKKHGGDANIEKHKGITNIKSTIVKINTDSRKSNTTKIRVTAGNSKDKDPIRVIDKLQYVCEFDSDDSDIVPVEEYLDTEFLEKAENMDLDKDYLDNDPRPQQLVTSVAGKVVIDSDIESDENEEQDSILGV